MGGVWTEPAVVQRNGWGSVFAFTFYSNESFPGSGGATVKAVCKVHVRRILQCTFVLWYVEHCIVGKRGCKSDRICKHGFGCYKCRIWLNQNCCYYTLYLLDFCSNNILLLLRPLFPKSVLCTTYCGEEGEILCDVDDQIERGQNCWCWRTLERGCLDVSLSDS